MLRSSTAISLAPLWACMACYWANFSFTVTFIILYHKGPAKDMKLGLSILHLYMFIPMAVVVYCMVFWRGWYLSFHSCKTWSGILTAVLYLTFKKFAYMYANTHKKNTTKINFVYSGNKVFFFCIFKLFCIICFIFQKRPFISQFYFFSSNNMFFLQTICHNLHTNSGGWRFRQNILRSSLSWHVAWHLFSNILGQYHFTLQASSILAMFNPWRYNQ
jgi:hypothetical protein